LRITLSEIKESPGKWRDKKPVFLNLQNRTNGKSTCRFDNRLKPYLLGIKNRFIISDLRMILPIRSSYSKRIYLLLKEYAKIGSQRVSNILKLPKTTIKSPLQKSLKVLMPEF